VRIRRLFPIALTIIIVSSACTGKLPETPAAFVAAASNTAQAEGSFHSKAKFEATGGGDDGGGFATEGWFDHKTNRSRTVVTADGTSFEFLTIGDNRYMGFGAGAGSWMKVTESDDIANEFPLGRDPVVRLGQLAPAATALKVLADDKVGETRVTRHHVIFDPTKILDDSGEQFLTEASALTMDFFLDSRGRPLRVEMEATFKAGESGFIASGKTDGVMKISIDIDGYGEPVDIQEPPADSIFDGLGNDPVLSPGITEQDILKRTDPPCFGAKVEACKTASAELKAAYDAPGACGGTTRRMCLLPVGNLPQKQIEELRAYFKDKYGLSVAVLPPMDATDAIGSQVNPDQWKVQGSKFTGELRRLYGNQISSGARIVAITPVDLHSGDDDTDSFVFGTKWNNSETKEGLYGIVSTFRMNPETFGEPANDALWFERMRKLVTKYVGIEYYGLVEDDDPASAMYRALYSVRALDGIKGHLPMAYGAPPGAPAPGPTTPSPVAWGPCFAAAAAGCLKADPALAAAPLTPGGCDVSGALLCIVPAGAVPASQIEELVARLAAVPGLKVAVAAALDIPADLVDPATGVITAGALIELAGAPDSVFDRLDSRKEISYLVIAPTDMAGSAGTGFGFFSRAKDDKTLTYRYSAFSTFRLNPATYGAADNEVLMKRMTILAMRAVGTVALHLPDSTDLTSPMLTGFTTLEQLDAMTGPLK
jgi:predicted Zn-dependent protease